MGFSDYFTSGVMGTRFLKGLGYDAVCSLGDRLKRVKRIKSPNLLRQDDVFFIVFSGRVKVYRHIGYRLRFIGVLGEGDVFIRFSDADYIYASFGSDVVFCSLSDDDFNYMKSNFFDFSVGVEKELKDMLFKSHKQLDLFVTTNLDVRLMGVLLDLTRRFGEDTGKGVLVDHGLIQGDLADLCGVTREAFNRSLKGLVDYGLVSVGTRFFVVLDVDDLQHRMSSMM